MYKWRDCVLWLKEIGFLPKKHRILRADTCLSDLVDLLQDGSVLCYVLHFIDPSSIDIRRVHNHSYGSEISSEHNAKLFLKSCREVYGIPNACLFEAHDLFYRHKFETVLESLNEISKSSHYISSRIASGKSPIAFDSSLEDESGIEDIYSDLPNKISDLKIEDEDTIYGQVDHESEDIYDELIYSRYKELEAFSQAPVKKDKKSLIVNELVETEREYVRVLDVIINHYYENLKPLVAPEKLTRMFCNNSIQSLLEYHYSLLSDMEKAVDMGHPVAGPLIVWQPKLANYAHYFSALDDAMAVIEDCLKDAAFRKKLEQLKETADIQQCRFNLSDVLRVPGQRILKYHLLIDNLKKSISSDNIGELSTTETACEKLKDLNYYMNESKRDAELKRKLVVLKDSIQDSELSKNVLCYGKLLKDGQLKVKFDQDNTIKKCHVFLFQRALLFSKDRSDFLSSNKSFEAKFKALFSDYDVDANTKSNNVVLKHKSDNRQISLICKNPGFQSEWFHLVMEASNCSDRDKLCYNRHQFELETFSEVKKCYFCDKLLKGAFWQGYKCRYCQSLSHRECLHRFTSCRSRRTSRADGRSSKQKPTLIVKPQPQPQIEFQNIQQGCSTTIYNATLPLNQPGCLFIVPGDMFEVFNDNLDCQFGLKARKLETGELGYVPTEYIQMLSMPTGDSIEKDTCVSVSKRNSFEETLKDYPWFTHVQSRETSSKNCLMCPESTFLVRKSESAMTFALMVHYNKVVRNIRIETNHEGRWYVAPEINFPSIPELVDFYQCNSLQSNFPQLPTTLITPFYDGVQKLKTQLLRPVQPSNKAQYVGLGQMIQPHISNDSREVDAACGELVKIVAFYSYNPAFCSVEVLKKYEVNNRDPEYLPVRGLVPNHKVKVF